ncbi:hypothetical protein E5676_scaffold892G00750 [Cucumis melo var. makuwa]|uniref:Uncharacterized protein n=2 Tax=Cucumis melo TaxID=3656 RepID=A0A5D3CWI8_CUCMM|nr:hypothetical protein E6C27_scaffold64G003660 [Cucumis melo var. makuwa]TYK15294.1 hypothetical protein E5676_scaffold892G00750 [Cucumis melo var. makuwa]
MTTLQRSSISFRRQGSSGFIWEDNVRVLEPKTSARATASASMMSQELNRSREERADETPKSDGLQNSSSTSTPPERTPQKCSFSSVFGRCMGSSSPAI